MDSVSGRLRNASRAFSLIITNISGGGQGWAGPTTCVSGYCCQFSNDWYSQCIPGTCNGGGGGSSSVPSISTTMTTKTSKGGAGSPTQTFSNPVLWEDLADNDVFRVGEGKHIP